MNMFESELWTTEKPTPESTEGNMFIWAYYDRGKWQIGLGYWTVTKGQWADAYAMDAKQRATHFHPMPVPPRY